MTWPGPCDKTVVTKIESGTKAINSVELRKIADYLACRLMAHAPAEDRSAVRFRRALSELSERVSAIERLVRDMLIQLVLGATAAWIARGLDERADRLASCE